MISSPNLSTTLLFNASRQWNLYIKRCMDASALKSIYALGCLVSFSLEPILDDMEGGQYVGPILLTALGDLVSRAIGRGGGGTGSGSGGGDRGADIGEDRGGGATKTILYHRGT